MLILKSFPEMLWRLSQINGTGTAFCLITSKFPTYTLGIVKSANISLMANFDQRKRGSNQSVG